MTTTDSTITLLPKDTIQDRISEAFDPHAGENLSRLIWRNPPTDGSHLPSIGLITRVLLAVDDYITDTTRGMPNSMATALAYPLRRETLLFLRACVSDEEWPAVEATWLAVHASNRKD